MNKKQCFCKVGQEESAIESFVFDKFDTNGNEVNCDVACKSKGTLGDAGEKVAINPNFQPQKKVKNIVIIIILIALIISISVAYYFISTKKRP